MNGLSKYYVKKIINCFAEEFTATATSQKLKINRNTVNKYYRIFREAVADYQEVRLQSFAVKDIGKHVPFSWHRNKGIELDYENGDITFVLLEEEDKVYVKLATTQDISAIETANEQEDGENGHARDYGYHGNYNGNSVAQSYPYFALGDSYLPQHLNMSATTKDFLNYAKEKLAKFYGVKPEYIYLYMKELEFRFNNRNKDLGRIIVRILPHHSRKKIC